MNAKAERKVKGPSNQRQRQGRQAISNPAVRSESESTDRLAARPVSHSVSSTFRSRQESETSHTSNQCWWKGLVYQLDATDSEQPPMPLESGTTKIVNQSDVRRCGQRWSPMYDSDAAVSVALPSFPPHVPLQPFKGDQTLQSVTDAEI
eukprot:64320-Amphidinium_carterae.3